MGRMTLPARSDNREMHLLTMVSAFSRRGVSATLSQEPGQIIARGEDRELVLKMEGGRWHRSTWVDPKAFRAIGPVGAEDSIARSLARELLGTL